MRSEEVARRGFLKAAGAGFVGSAWTGLPEKAIAKSDPDTKPAYDVRAFGARGDGKALDTAANS